MSNNKSVMNVRLAAELDHAFERSGWTPVMVKALSTGNFLNEIEPLLHGYADVVMKNHIIDLTSDVFIPKEWGLESHKCIKPQIEFDPAKLKLCLSEYQQQHRKNDGYELRAYLEDKLTLNANVLEYLLKYPEIIPETWKGKHVFFWGTIYYNALDELCVRALYWRGEFWDWNFHCLHNLFGEQFPALVVVN